MQDHKNAKKKDCFLQVDVNNKNRDKGVRKYLFWGKKGWFFTFSLQVQACLVATFRKKSCEENKNLKVKQCSIPI